jgi:hypothetical protein
MYRTILARAPVAMEDRPLHRDHLVIGSGFEFEERGARRLKGGPQEWHLFAVAPPQH